MATKKQVLEEICSQVRQEAHGLYPNLTLTFIRHTSGTLHEFATMHDHALAAHPAGRVAQEMLDNNSRREQSSFIGMANHHTVKWFGLASNECSLALFNINIDEFTNAKDMRRAVYHLVWHAIDLMGIKQKKEYAARFRSGPMVPKRSPMNLARLNMQADVFSGIMCGLHGEKDSLDFLARLRARESVMPSPLRRAEDYPFVIALDPAKYANEIIENMNPGKSKFMRFARQAALDISKTFDDKAIRQWWGFSEPAQDMAWRNFPSDHILGCAVYTSTDPFVRAVAHTVSDLVGVEPSSAMKDSAVYNSFAAKDHNRLLHREIAERTFEDAIAKGMREESGQSLISAANEQNENLTEGIILGWCANALQAASRAFDKALTTGASPMQAARMEFLGTKDAPPWETLERIGDEVLAQKKRGIEVTLGQIADITRSDDAFKPVLTSVKTTMSDSDYMEKLAAANDLSVRPASPAPSGPAPSAPALKGPAPTQPVYAAAPQMPGLGGSSRRMVRPATVPPKETVTRQDSSATVPVEDEKAT